MELRSRVSVVFGSTLIALALGACGKGEAPSNGPTVPTRAKAPEPVTRTKRPPVTAASPVTPPPAPAPAPTPAPAPEPAPEAAGLPAWDKVKDAPWRAKALRLPASDPRTAICKSWLEDVECTTPDDCQCWLGEAVSGGAAPLAGAAVIGAIYAPAEFNRAETWGLALDTGSGWVAGAPILWLHEDQIGFFRAPGWSGLELRGGGAAARVVVMSHSNSDDAEGNGPSEVRDDATVCAIDAGKPLCAELPVSFGAQAEDGPIRAIWSRPIGLTPEGSIEVRAATGKLPDGLSEVVEPGTYPLATVVERLAKAKPAP